MTIRKPYRVGPHVTGYFCIALGFPRLLVGGLPARSLRISDVMAILQRGIRLNGVEVALLRTPSPIAGLWPAGFRACWPRNSETR
jgi:hypothetical protein